MSLLLHTVFFLLRLPVGWDKKFTGNDNDIIVLSRQTVGGMLCTAQKTPPLVGASEMRDYSCFNFSILSFLF